jgi:hypothetical protein
MKSRTQALEAVAHHARISASWLTPELNDALDELRQVEAADAASHIEALKARGADCKECGKRFLPLLHGDPNFPFCSLGCRMGGDE